MVRIEGVSERFAESVPQLHVQLGGQAVRAGALAALHCFGGGRELADSEGLIAGGGIGGCDSGVDGGEELVLCRAAGGARGKVVGVVVSDDALRVGEAVGRVEGDIGAGGWV